MCIRSSAAHRNRKVVTVLPARPHRPAQADAAVVHRCLPHGPAAARLARYEVRRALRCLPPDGLRHDVELAVSELVTNAVEHGAAPVALTLRRATGAADDPVIVVEVRDGGQTDPAAVGEPSGGEPLAPRGRGLGIVSALSARWGVETGRDRTTVWCVFPVGGADRFVA